MIPFQHHMRLHLIKSFLILSLTLVAINSCKGQHSNIPPKECIALNDKAMTLLMNYPMNGEQELNTAIDLLKQAISCDSTDWVFYINLGNAYDKKHNYNGEMAALNKVLTLTKNDPAILLQIGMLYEVKGRVDSAKNMYQLTEVEYEKRLAKNPKDVNLIKGNILLKGVTDGKDEAIKALNEQIKIHPELSSQLSGELLFYKYFNRHDFVFRLPTVTDLSK